MHKMSNILINQRIQELRLIQIANATKRKDKAEREKYILLCNKESEENGTEPIWKQDKSGIWKRS